MRAQKLTLAALTLAAGLTLTACQGDDEGTSQGASSPQTPTSSANGGSGSGGSGGSDQGGGTDSAGEAPAGQGTPGKGSADQGTDTGAGPKKGGKAAKCRTDNLTVTATDGTIGGDRNATVVVEFKNKGARGCTIAGYAGVDLRTSAGALSAKRSGEQAPSTVLKVGQSTFVGIHYPFDTSGGSGVRVTGLVVTPPNETKSVTLAWPGAATLPASDGAGSTVEVGPIGSAGQGG
ncbi:DUF4232 domain-containing protein [Streptomyces sp. HSW2009]|uniref:DUF4232 domain-containing protein n=1 Tax=Streptomyces sp. HSW2009 TaxID=3142890 RepID=UPI0032ED3C51